VLLDVSSERAKQRDKNTVVTVNNILQMSGLTGNRMNGVCCRKCEEGVVMKQLVSVFCTWQLAADLTFVKCCWHQQANLVRFHPQFWIRIISSPRCIVTDLGVTYQLCN
jgi:hypothetical protein